VVGYAVQPPGINFVPIGCALGPLNAVHESACHCVPASIEVTAPARGRCRVCVLDHDELRCSVCREGNPLRLTTIRYGISGYCCGPQLAAQVISARVLRFQESGRPGQSRVRLVPHTSAGFVPSNLDAVAGCVAGGIPPVLLREWSMSRACQGQPGGRIQPLSRPTPVRATVPDPLMP
jgi:hypothetical protein